MDKLDIKQIENILPHRYPFLLVDRILELEPGIRAKAIKNVTRNEEFFNGHFPGEPVMPGVLMIEAMAQIGGIVALTASDDNKGKLAFFASIDGVRFRQPVVPGDQLIFEVETIKLKSSIAKMQGKGFVDGRVVVEGELMFSLIDNKLKSSSSNNIHATAQVHPTAEIGTNVNIGPYTIIGEKVIIGNNVNIDSHIMIRDAIIGSGCNIRHGAVIGEAPQDISFKDEDTRVVIGDNTEIREYVTIHRATGSGQSTTIGSDCLICSNAHIAHNCHIGDKVVIVSHTQVAGHVEIGDRAVIAGMVGITQFVKIGSLAMVGGYSKIVQDVPPYMLIDGNPAFVHGINIVGLQRNNIPTQAITEIKSLYKIIYRSTLNLRDALEEFKNKHGENISIETKAIIDFISNSKKGISKKQKSLNVEDEEAESYSRLENEGLFAKLKLF